MEQSCNILVIWRGKQFDVNVNPDSNVKEFGQKLQELTNVRPDTMRLFVPQKNNKGSKMLSPFSDVHSMLSLRESAILEGKTIKMMGVFSDEVDEVSHNSNKPDLRIAGFAEEEQRLRQRTIYRPQASLKLPQGTYIFCEFRTLQIPGIELNPPPSEALRRMHMLACDPGIIAIMNKHRWRVGIMSEMAPEGYVGISPKCILGFNKNHGEEICLRLRTDDLKGFRKYESIKRTLLHELAHMVYSEHDSNFFALNKQLNEEAASLDWTKSTSHTLNGRKYLDHYEEEDYVEPSSKNSGQKLGGATNSLVSARASSIAAAYNRMANASFYDHMPVKSKEPDPDDSQLMDNQGKFSEPDPDDMVTSENDAMLVDMVMDARRPFSKSSMLDMLDELDPDDSLDHKNMSEPDPENSLDNKNISEPDPDDSLDNKDISELDPDDSFSKKNESEPDPDDCLDSKNMSEPDPDDSHARGLIVSRSEPDPDDTLGGEDIKLAKETDSTGTRSNKVSTSNLRDSEPDPDDSLNNVLLDAQMEEMHLGKHCREPDLDGFVKDMILGDYERLQQSADQNLSISMVEAQKEQILADDPSHDVGSLLLDPSPSDPQPAAVPLVLEERFALVRSVGEECIQEEELMNLLAKKPVPVCYDGFEPSGRMHIAQGVMKTINVNKLTSAGCTVKIWIADWFAQLNNKMGGDLKKIHTVGRYLIEIWKAVGMNLDKVEFLWSSEEINSRAHEYWPLVMDIARRNTLHRIIRCSQIMGRSEKDELTAAQILYPCMQCADIFFLKADICQLGMDQRKVNVLAREYCDDIKKKNKPIILSHHMLPGLQEGQEKMSKSDPSSSIYMEDEEGEVNVKIKKAYCPPKVVEGNPCLEYIKYIVFPWFGHFEVVRKEENGGNKTYNNMEELILDYESGVLHPADLKPALSKALNLILQPVRDHFKNNSVAKDLLKSVKAYRVTR